MRFEERGLSVFSDSIDAIRQAISPAALRSLWDRGVQVVILSLGQGLGKSEASKKFALDSLRRSDTNVLVVAAENKDKMHEFHQHFRANRPTGMSIIKIAGRDPAQCPEFEKIQKLLDNGLLRLVQEKCKTCSNECEYQRSKKQLRDACGQPLVIVTTQAYLQLNPFVLQPFNGQVVVLIWDEAEFLMPREKRSYVNLEYKVLTAVTEQYRKLSLSPKIQALIEQCHAALEGSPVHPVNVRLTLEDERQLESHDLPNLSQVAYAINRNSLRPRHGVFRVKIPIKVKGTFTIVAAAGVSKALYQATFPGSEPHEISMVLNAESLPPGTAFHRIHDSCGAVRSFPGNSRRLCEFAAGYIQLRNPEGGNLLLVAKKNTIPTIVDQLNPLLRELGLSCQVVQGGEARPGVIPIVNYGIKGENTYEHLQNTLCVNSYNADPKVISEHLSHIFDYRRFFEINVDVGFSERVVSGLLMRDERLIAEILLDHYERGVVLQAIGRIRPFTYENKEVVTIQCSEVLEGERVFHSLEQARRFFGLKTFATTRKSLRDDRIRQLFADGVSKSEIARQLNISRPTVIWVLKGECDADNA